MPRGPLPTPDKRRRNGPTIPTTTLPVEGRKGDAPKSPYPLAKAGRECWEWAWATPQATAWDPGALYVVARRASLEDDLETLDNVGDLTEVVGMPDEEAVKQLEFIVARLKGIASGRTTVMREMRELDRQLGFGAKAMADLRWQVGDVEPQADGPKRPPARKASADRRARLSVVA